MTTYKFDYVFHYAAVVGVQRTLENPLLVLKDLEGIKNILETAKNTKVKKVFYSSSSEVYGEPVEFPQNEDTTPLNSKLPYAVVKNLGEVFKELALHKESEILEGHLMGDHVHILISIPPKYASGEQFLKDTQHIIDYIKV